MPRFDVGEGLGENIGYLRLGAYMQELDLGCSTDFEQPGHVDAVSPWKMSECNRSALLDNFDDCLIVLSNDEKRRALVALWSGEVEVETWVEVVFKPRC